MCSLSVSVKRKRSCEPMPVISQDDLVEYRDSEGLTQFVSPRLLKWLNKQARGGQPVSVDEIRQRPSGPYVVEEVVHLVSSTGPDAWKDVRFVGDRWDPDPARGPFRPIPRSRPREVERARKHREGKGDASGASLGGKPSAVAPQVPSHAPHVPQTQPVVLPSPAQAPKPLEAPKVQAREPTLVERVRAQAQARVPPSEPKAQAQSLTLVERVRAQAEARLANDRRQHPPERVAVPVGRSRGRVVYSWEPAPLDPLLDDLAARRRAAGAEVTGILGAVTAIRSNAQDLRETTMDPVRERIRDEFREGLRQGNSRVVHARFQTRLARRTMWDTDFRQSKERVDGRALRARLFLRLQQRREQEEEEESEEEEDVLLAEPLAPPTGEPVDWGVPTSQVPGGATMRVQREVQVVAQVAPPVIPTSSSSSPASPKPIAPAQPPKSPSRLKATASRFVPAEYRDRPPPLQEAESQIGELVPAKHRAEILSLFRQCRQGEVEVAAALQRLKSLQMSRVARRQLYMLFACRLPSRPGRR